MDTDLIFPHSEEFWTFAQNSLRCSDPEDLTTVNRKLVAFLKTVADHIQIFVNDDQDLYRCALSLVSCEFYEQNKNFCIAKQLSLLSIDCLDQNFRLFVSYVLLLDCKNDSTLLQVIQDYQGFTVIYHSLHTLFETLALLDDDRDSGSLGVLRKTCTVQLDIMFQLCKYLSISYEELSVIDTFFINYIFESLVVADVDDMFNAAKFKFILAVNEQFMIVSRDHKLENKVLSTIATHTTFRNFSECLLMFFNREEDRCLQIMISKILYLILTNKESSDLFYHNDLNVLVDVLMRELHNLSDDEESIRNTFLRVLHPLLKRRQFETTQYKKDGLVSLLKYHAGVGHTFWNPSETTKRLASRCLSVKWLQDDPAEVESINSNDSSIIDRSEKIVTDSELNNSSETSLLSISKKRPPPPPLPRKLVKPTINR
jgi:hypothetical protein